MLIGVTPAHVERVLAGKRNFGRRRRLSLGFFYLVKRVGGCLLSDVINFRPEQVIITSHGGWFGFGS
jgi:hypothetical protein